MLSNSLAFAALLKQHGGEVRIRREVLRDMVPACHAIEMYFDHVSGEYVYTLKDVHEELTGMSATGVIVDDYHPINQKDEE